MIKNMIDDSKQFEERADYIDLDDLMEWTADTAFFDKIQTKITERGAKVIVGPRGTGKTHHFRHAYYKCLKNSNKPLALYISFGKYYYLEPLLFKSANAINVFHTWILAKIVCEIINVANILGIDFQENLEEFSLILDDLLDFIERAEKNLANNINDEVISKLSIQKVIMLIDKLLDSTNKKRCILLLDDAALTLTPEYMIEFFDVFRSLKTQNISPKASVYPGTTQYGPRFHIGQDAEEVSVWLNVEDESYSKFMSEIISKRLSNINLSEEYIEAFKFASFGIPRAFITLIRAFLFLDVKTNQQKFNKVLEDQKNLLEKEYLSLSLKLPQYKSIIEGGLIFFNQSIEVVFDANKNNANEKKTHIGIEQKELSSKLNRMLKFLIEAGLLYELQPVRNGESEKFNRYIPHYLFLINAKVFSSTRGFNLKSQIQSMNRKPDKRPIRKSLAKFLDESEIDKLKLDLPPCSNCGEHRISEEQKFCHKCGSPLVGQSTFETILKTKISDLPLPKWQIDSILKNSKLKTIEDLYSSQNLAKDLKDAKGIGKVRTTNIEKIVKEFLE
jgi:hypothetical protein